MDNVVSTPNPTVYNINGYFDLINEPIVKAHFLLRGQKLWEIMANIEWAYICMKQKLRYTSDSSHMTIAESCKLNIHVSE